MGKPKKNSRMHSAAPWEWRWWVCLVLDFVGLLDVILFKGQRACKTVSFSFHFLTNTTMYRHHHTTTHNSCSGFLRFRELEPLAQVLALLAFSDHMSSAANGLDGANVALEFVRTGFSGCKVAAILFSTIAGLTPSRWSRAVADTAERRVSRTRPGRCGAAGLRGTTEASQRKQH